jgi:hypothetical protein
VVAGLEGLENKRFDIGMRLVNVKNSKIVELNNRKLPAKSTGFVLYFRFSLYI